jgi:hypothetical protein
MHGRDKSDQTEKMIPMQVTDENMINFVDPYPVFAKPELSTFTTID